MIVARIASAVFVVTSLGLIMRRAGRVAVKVRSLRGLRLHAMRVTTFSL